LSRPICSYNWACSASWSWAGGLLPWLKRSSAPASSCFFQAWISVGWTWCWLANSLTVLSCRNAANATCALNAAVCDFRFLVIVSPFLDRRLCSLVGCPVFGVHYSETRTDPLEQQGVHEPGHLGALPQRRRERLGCL